MVTKEMFVRQLTSVHDSFVRSFVVSYESDCKNFDLKLIEETLVFLGELTTGEKTKKVFDFMKSHNFGYDECKEFGTNDALHKLFSDFYDSLVGKNLFDFKVAVEIANPSNTVQYIYIGDLNKDKMSLQRFTEIYFNFGIYEGQPALQGSNKKWHIFVTPNSYVVRQKDEDGSWNIRVFDKDGFDELYRSLDKEHEQKTVWMARDKDGGLFLYKNKPWLNTVEGLWLDWDFGYVDYKDCNMYLLQLDSNIFSYVKYGYEPIELKVGELNVDIKDRLKLLKNEYYINT